MHNERQSEILKEIKRKNKATVKELSQLFHVSEVTIRKDLDELCDTGLAIRTHGGVMRCENTRSEKSLEENLLIASKEKSFIARYAANEIRDGETIMISGGTTTQQLAIEIQKKEWKDLTILTNAVNIINILRGNEGILLELIGGRVRKKYLTCVGPLTEDGVKQFRVDKVFVSSNGISFEYGLTASNVTEGSVVRHMLRSGQRRYVLMSSQKFGINSMYRVCDIEEIHTIITDGELDYNLRERFRGKKCELICVNASEE